ncbi:MAG: hypothetical protein AAGC60_10730 [Acidobacteriota bacterium]
MRALGKADAAAVRTTFSSCRAASLVLVLLGWCLAGAGQAVELRVLTVGLGDGVVTSSTGILNCGTTCNETVPSATTVTLVAASGASSTFVGWDGACSGTASTCTLTTGSVDLAAVARFDLSFSIPTLTDFTPTGIDTYLATYPAVNTPARFVAALPAEFRRSWMLMTRSESLQTGTAEYPRILLPSGDMRFVFTIGMATHSSYPGAHPNAIEYMQWDAAEKNFRFHEIVLAAIPPMGTLGGRGRGVEADDFKCTACHSTGNILNATTFPGTTGVSAGVVPPRNKPNWDTYDSWGGMLPFNRDRVYVDSVEAAAFRAIFNLWNWRGSPDDDAVRRVLEQLELQPSHSNPPSPHSITRNLPAVDDATHIAFGFDGLAPITTFVEPVDYSFSGPPVASSNVTQGGRYVTLRHETPIPTPMNDDYLSPQSDEGRGVQFFDLLGGFDGQLNVQRIADELIDHRFATSNTGVDVRPMALAIARGCLQVSGSTVVSTAPTALSVPTAFFDARTGSNIAQIVADTRIRAESLPRRKADIQRLNLDRVNDPYLMSTGASDGLILEYGAATGGGTSTTIQRLRNEVFRRPVDLGSPAVTVGNDYVDRELYGVNTNKMALFRYFLEPLGVPVDSWSMGVRGRSRTYTFADVFGFYESGFIADLTADLTARPAPPLSDPTSCDALVQAVNAMYTTASLPAAVQIPTYTDIQRIFNRTCIECHNDLGYPPYHRYSGGLDLTETDTPTGTATRFSRAHGLASTLAPQILNRVTMTSENCPYGMMPCGGPALSQTDIETLRRWINGGAPLSVGDPHVRTVDGVSYDFQAAGEFTLLRDESFELQVRQIPVTTAGPLGPNAYTGLTSCVSLNGAVALRFGDQRVTYQPNLDGFVDPDRLELRIDGMLVDRADLPLTHGAVRVETTPVDHGVKIRWVGGTEVLVTPRFWHHHQIWYMNLEVRTARATRGLMGVIDTGEWLPALADGSLLGPRPAPLWDRYDQLYWQFGESWRVTDETSLFDYAPGTSTETFTDKEWPLGESPKACEVLVRPNDLEPAPALQPLDPFEAAEICAELVDDELHEHCTVDVAVTGEPDLAVAYFGTEKLMRNAPPTAPQLEAPSNFDDQAFEPVKLVWRAATDPDDGQLSYRLCLWPADTIPRLDECIALEDQGSPWLSYPLEGLELGQAYLWRVFVDDGQGATSESETWRFVVPALPFD